MTELKAIKAAAKAAFEQEDYQLAFQTLWKGGFADFIHFGEKQAVKADWKLYNWFNFPKSAEFFWNSFILEETVFKEIFGSDFSEQMLHNYFFKSAVLSEEFEIKLAKEYPQKFVNAVRVNQVYLKPDRIERLCSLQFSDDLSLHQKVWRKIYDTDKIIWREIQAELIKVSQQPLTDILSHCIIWLESYRFHNGSTGNVHQLASVYSFFVEMLISKYPEKSTEELGGEMFFYQKFLPLATKLYAEKKTIDESPTANILSQISSWINYKECVISPYSFDLDIQPKQENELILFNVSPELRYKWRLNGVRYEINQLHYILCGAEMVECLEENNKLKIPGKTKEDIESNRKLAELKWSTVLLLNDMGINIFRFGDSNVDVEILLAPLLAYSYNRILRYELSLAKHRQNSKNWQEAFIKQCMEAMISTIRREPFLLMSKDEFKELNKSAMERLSDESAEQVAQIASYKIDSKYEFNRYNHRYDVFQKPLLRVDDNFFCPMMFFASNIWFYTFAQEGLRRYKSKETERNETRIMETYFGARIAAKGWAVKVLMDSEANQLEGDVDIFVEDSDTLLFIQLKRTYFRLTLKDAYYESINMDRKAASQLNEAEAFLTNDNGIYTVTKKPVKWIVSTSCENIGESIDGCKKANYFDVLRALNNPEIRSLNDLIVDVERDRNLKKMAQSIFNIELPKEWGQLVFEAGLPLEMFETKEYRQSIFTEDEARTVSYNELYNQAAEHYKGKRLSEALVLFHKCITINPKDAEAFAALGNILMDMGLRKEAFPLFTQALELAPNDPCISRDLSLALMEAGRFYDGLSLSIKLYEKFPLLGDLRILFEGHFERCIKRGGILNPDQVIELQTKWDSLN